MKAEFLLAKVFSVVNKHGPLLLLVGVTFSSLFLLSGGFSAVQSYLFGAQSYLEYRAASTAPVFAGFLMMGAFGLLYTYKNRGSSRCLVGLLITVFCYAVIEGLFGVL